MDSYYSKYLKYKTKYLNLKKMIGGNNFKEFTREELISDLTKFANGSTGVFKKYCKYGCNGSVYNMNTIKTFDYYQKNLCIFGKEDEIWLGKLTSTTDDFKAYGDTKPQLFFDCVNIYDYGRFNNYNEANHSTGQKKTIGVQFNSDVVDFFGFISETEKDAVIQAAKQIRQNSPKSKK